MEKRANGNEIEYPNTPSEMDTGAELVRICKAVGMDLRLEVPFRGFVFDGVQFCNSKPACILEIKRKGTPTTIRNKEQLENYTCLCAESGLQFLYCLGYDSVDKIVHALAMIHCSHVFGKPFNKVTELDAAKYLDIYNSIKEHKLEELRAKYCVNTNCQDMNGLLTNL